MSTHFKISKYRTSWSKLGRDLQRKQQHGEGWDWPSGHRPWMQGGHIAGVTSPPQSTRSSESSAHGFPLGTDPAPAMQSGRVTHSHTKRGCVTRGDCLPCPHGRLTRYQQVTQQSGEFYWNK